MFSLLAASPLAFVIMFGGLILSLTIHEFAHAFMADRLGDPTPRMQGRLTLNPLAHLDPVGTLLLLFTRFGWGKPVMFDPDNLRNPLRDTALIALAGPVSNIILALLCAIVIHLSPESILSLVLSQIIFINLSLAIFNLVPIHPLDGGKIILALLPPDTAMEYDHFMHQYGMFVLIALILPIYNGAAPVNFLITPIINAIANLLL